VQVRAKAALKMATIYTHGFFGLVLGKTLTARPMRAWFWILAALLPILPDSDVFSPATYGTIWGHRGFTHSFTFAAGISLVAAAAMYRYLKGRFMLLWGFYFLATASHGVLDAFTNGGYGIPFFWPFSMARFGPWGPIQVADIAFEFPDPRTSRSVRTELLYVWLPTILLVAIISGYRYAIKRRSRRMAQDPLPIQH
jgi:inner membrane protein